MISFSDAPKSCLNVSEFEFLLFNLFAGEVFHIENFQVQVLTNLKSCILVIVLPLSITTVSLSACI